MRQEVTASPEQVRARCQALARQFREELACREEQKVRQFQDQVALRLQGLEKEREHLAAQMKAQPRFQLRQRRFLQGELDRVNRCIAEYSGLGAVQQARMEFARKVEKAASRYQAQLENYLARRFPCQALLRQAQDTFNSWYPGSNSQLKDRIYAALEKTPEMTARQIGQADPLLQERSQRRIQYLLEELMAQGQVRQELQGDRTQYRVSGPRPPKRPRYPQVEEDYEDPQVAQEPIPLPPRAENVL